MIGDLIRDDATTADQDVITAVLDLLLVIVKELVESVPDCIGDVHLAVSSSL